MATVKGAGRRRAAARTKKVEANEQRLEEVKRDEVTGNKPTARRRAAAKKAAAPAPPQTHELEWLTDKSLGENVDRLKTAGKTWKAIAEMANDQDGIDMPWPDGGKLLRARKQFLAGTEGQAPKRGGGKPRAPRAVSQGEASGSSSLTKEERLAAAFEERGSQVWEESEMSNEDLVSYFSGRQVTWVNTLTGNMHSARLARDSAKTRIENHPKGDQLHFAATDGPFMAVYLSNIIHVN